MPQFKYRASGTYVIASQGTGTGAAGYQVTVTPRESWVGSLVFQQNIAPPGSTPNYVSVAYQDADTAEEVAAGTAITATAALIISPTVGDLVVVYTHTSGEIVLNVNPATTGVTNSELRTAFLAAGYSTAGQDTTQAMLSVAVADMLGQTINVKAFGAKGDGVTDDTAAIQAAADAAAVAGTPLHFPAGTYVIATSVAVQGDYDVIQWVGDGHVVLNGSTSTADQLITVGGTAGTGVALTASPSRGDLVISSTLASSLVKGDIVHIVSTDVFSPVSAFFVKGELAEVEAVSGNNITLRTALYDSYTDSTTTVAKVNAPRVLLENLRIVRNSSHDGLSVEYGRNIDIRNVRLSGCRRRTMELWYCVGGVVTNCGSDDAWVTALGLSYGLSVNSSQWLTVTGGVWYGGRHAIAHGGTTPIRGMTYLGVTMACDFVDSTVGTLDFHDAAEFNVVQGCTIFGSLAGSYRNLTVIGNRFQSVTDEGSVSGGFASSSAYFIFRDNYCESQDAGYGVRLSFSQPNVTMGLVDISDNRVTAGSGIVIADGSQASSVITKLKLNGNVVSVTGASQEAVSISSATNLTVGDGEIIGGLLETSTNACITYLVTATSRSLRIVGATLRTTGNFRQFDIRNVQHVTIAGSRIEGNGFASASFVQDVPNTVLRDNYFYNIGTGGGFTCALSGLSVAICQESGNVLDTVTGAMSASAGAIFVDYLTSTGRRIGRGTAAPVAGAWLQGDTVWNTAPAAAGVPGWMCTTAGTPGTWKAMAALAP